MRLHSRWKAAYVSPEFLFWFTGLLVLAFVDPAGSGLPDLCIYRLMGFEGCPGCGLGRSVSFLLHGEPALSLEAHILGPFALTMMLYRILVLTRTLTINRKEHSHA